MTDNKSLGQRLYELRREKGLSQERVAEELGVTRQTVSKWETDQSTPDFDKILPLCRLFDISTQELITGESDNDEAVDKNDSYGSYDNYYNTQSDNAYDTQSVSSAEQNDYEQRYNKYKVRFAVLTSVAVCLYILSVIPFFIFEKSSLMLSTFFVIIAVATMLLIFGTLAKPKKPEANKEMTKEEKLQKQIKSIMSGITLAIYLFVSFLTNAWHITWLIWVIYGVAEEIIKLIFTLKGAENNE